jgi:8-oxo-dGTP pyrophosphatase MutT (NUDIX family)
MLRMDEPEPPIASGPWTRRSRRVAYENPWITIWHDEVTRPDGQPGIYGVVHFANLAAGVLVLDDEDRVLLVGQHRYALDEYAWEIPEGGVPAGETALEGAQRELVEETGVVAQEWRELARVHLSNSVSDELAVLFVASGLTRGVAAPDGSSGPQTRAHDCGRGPARFRPVRRSRSVTVGAPGGRPLARHCYPATAQLDRSVATGDHEWSAAAADRPAARQERVTIHEPRQRRI